MSQYLVNCESFLRIKLKYLIDQINEQWIRVTEILFWCFLFDIATLLNEFFSVLTFDRENILVVRLSSEL